MATLAERILGAPAGTCVDRAIDRAYAMDGTGVLALHTFRQIGRPLAKPGRLRLIFDHIVPANNSTSCGR